MTVLKTVRLTLSPCTPVDRVDFIQLELDPEVMRFLNNGAVDHDRIDPANAPFLMPRGTEPNVWTARRNAEDEFVGWFCLSPKGKAVAEIGYRLRREAWGQGLAFEGASALISWGFEVTGYE
jgi:RimJ/RimL family protein N-acetyltransferase